MVNNYLQKMGGRIQSEFNDLKRTLESASEELNIDLQKLENIISGNCNLGEIHELIFKMGEKYPIDISDLFLLKDDCDNGIKIMNRYESELSNRIFNRKNKNNILKPYYEYRDTAMSRLSPFKPEWIRELRVVEDSNPDNSDVIYNNGHFLHQITFFIGPVNFYWKENGQSYCKEMNTGDSNYITPFYPHSFTSRNKNKDAIIIAVTFGGEARKNQKELYWLGNDRVQKFINMGKKKQKQKLIPISVKRSDENPKVLSSYKIKELANISHLSLAKGFDIEVLDSDEIDTFETSFHSYIYNYGKSSTYFYSEYNGETYKKLFEPDDSIYVQPFIKYSFENKEKNNANILVVNVETSINDSTQLELSYFNNNDRITKETKRWF